jgi:hypothetical protein
MISGENDTVCIPREEGSDIIKRELLNGIKGEIHGIGEAGGDIISEFRENPLPSKILSKCESIKGIGGDIEIDDFNALKTEIAIGRIDIV